ncbi:MAG TPA: GAF domain-containing protein [Caldithrix abyssi]|uniref:GAF domain-containing protein n=1 Tax=Caldithrix abyssi TaxID=187145 RepID=A0A7V4TXE3_CALAY|nr:GAF domain-containing protein [Caldithrix abyssi]
MVSIPTRKEIETLQQENEKLRTTVTELSVLNDIAIAISSSQSLDKIIDLIVQKCIRYFSVEQAAVLLLEQKDKKDRFRTLVRRADQSRFTLPYRLNDLLTGWMIKNRKPLLINDFENDSRFPCPESPIAIHSLLCVPLMLKGNMTGLICLFNKKDAGLFTEQELRLLSIIASESAQVIENARLLETEKEYLRTREELRMAASIQRELLPKEIPQLPNYEMAAINIPARTVSGDYYDFVLLSENQIAFCLGDVSGKGMPAALLTANLQATLRSQIFLKNPPAKCLAYSNTLLFNNTSAEKFATLFYGVIDTADHTLSFCNAGHDPPYLLSTLGRMRRLKSGGIVLGFLSDFAYSEEDISLEKGDVLFLFSDGVTEAMNPAEKEFSEERLEQVLQELRENSAREIIDTVLSEIRQHMAGANQADDITMVVIKRIN